MFRNAFLLGLLALLAAGPAPAHPTHTSWPFWLSKPERHGSRKLAGDYTHHYGTYRHHSRNEGDGLFSFLHTGNRRSALARRKGRAHASKARHRRTSGIFK
jgi:hypothetical protein